MLGTHAVVESLVEKREAQAEHEPGKAAENGIPLRSRGDLLRAVSRPEKGRVRRDERLGGLELRLGVEKLCVERRERRDAARAEIGDLGVQLREGSDQRLRIDVMAKRRVLLGIGRREALGRLRMLVVHREVEHVRVRAGGYVGMR